MSTAYVRIYKSPDTETDADVLGFSRRVAEGASDPALHGWLQVQGYEIDPNVRPDQTITLVNYEDGAKTSYTVPGNGRRMPQETISLTHLYVEPSLREDDLVPLGRMLGRLASCDPGSNRGILVDNRMTDPFDDADQGAATSGKRLAAW